MRTVLILGATSSVAVELAKIYAQKDHSLQLAARSVDRLAPLKSDLAIRFNCRADLFEFDVEDTAQHQRFYDSLSVKPDIVVCLFGVLGDQLKAQDVWTEALQILTVNYVGAVSILNIIAKDFKNRRTGIIVGVSSVAGERGRQSNFLYGSAKAGFTAYLSGLRNQLSQFNVHVITVKPGFIKSKMTANITTPKILTASSRTVAQAIVKAVTKRKDVVYSLWIWRWIMMAIKLIPESVFKKLKL
jgi:decaprenylphospho-beta-D-erythro-pentofuranosid-2-ulose 2-reductase